MPTECYQPFGTRTKWMPSMIYSNAFSWKKNNCNLIQISLKFVPKGMFIKKSALVQVMAWHRTGDEPFTWLIDDTIHWHHMVSLIGNELTYTGQHTKYPVPSWTIPCLLMTWLLVSPGHQQSWYWLCVMMNVSILWCLNVRERHST